ncbi:serine hydrolase [Frigoribacterium sp. PvP032]|uniref:serine hydrolase n=1 Tax=Frigoribacterium sp. PvP032 TaxID=2806589 RepID=UPI0027DDDA5D|nr:serine hydrolase [Frigoribacterium sp. PvP032]
MPPEGGRPGRHSSRSDEGVEAGRHAPPTPPAGLGGALTALGDLAAEGVRVSASVWDLDDGSELLAVDDRVVLPVGQLGAVLLLIEVSAQIEAGRLGALDELERTAGPGSRSALGGGGVWSYLQRRRLAVTDAAALVGAVRDPAAVNALLGRVGLDAVRTRADDLGLRQTALLDEIRSERGPDDAPAASVGSTRELAQLTALLAQGQVVGSAVSSRVLGWLSLGVDLSFVAAPLGLDPVSHRRTDHGLQLVNAVGSDRGARSELGVLRGPRGGVAYAVTVAFDDLTLEHRLRVLDAARAVGADLLARVR